MNDQSGMPTQGIDFDPFDFAVTQPLQRVAGAAEDNPDDAARAVDLSKSTGVPAPVIAADRESFEQVHRSSLANQIMRSNPALIDYVRSHPMAASVSNDDWSNLADIAKSSDKLHSLLAMDPLRGALEGAGRGAAEGFMQKTLAQQSIDDWYGDKPLAWSIISAAAFVPEGVLRGFNALMGAQFGALKGGAETAYKAATGDEEGARIFGENAVQVGNVLLAGSLAGTAEGSPALGEALFKSDPTSITGELLRQREAFQAIKPWTDANLMPPRGVHPEADKALGELNAEGVARLKQVLADSQKSSTRERSYEMFRSFADQQHGDATIGIHGPAVAALYGDKVPEPGDGLLGFVPHIGDQLLAAHISGLDVQVPIKEWLSQVDPAVAQQLWDHVRVFHGGITADEAKVPFEPRPTVDAPIAQVRGAAGLEPRFSLGDRKLTLGPEPYVEPYEDGFWHRHDFIDPTGKPVGRMDLFEDPAAKELWVDWIGRYGVSGEDVDLPNSLGPAAVRDLLRQIKEKYPGYTITGERISGAREVSGGGIKEPQIKLSLDKLPEPGDRASPSSLREVDSKWRDFNSGAMAKVSDAVDTIVHSELRRIVGQFPELIAADKIVSRGRLVEGLFQPLRERPPVIAWDALNPQGQRIGTARHEAIHYLRGYGFFTDEEWAELGWQAVQNNWIDRYDIRRYYSDLDIEGQIEEAVAEGYRHWASGELPVEEPTGLVARAFQRMKDLWEGIKDKLRQFFGQDINISDLLSSVHEGRIARRGQTSPSRYTGALQPKFSISEEDFQNLKASSLGLDAKSWKNLQDSLKARHEADLTAAVKREEQRQRQEQTSEWKSNLRGVRAEVERTIRQRPDVASDLFVNSGEYEGEKLKQRIPLRADDLTDEQKASLPSSYYAKSGLPVADVARLFGYQDGQHLVERLGVMARQRGDRTPQAHLKSLIDGETQLRMERQHGRLEDNIMEAASDQALSDTDINLLVDEYVAAGMMAKQPTLDKNTIKAQAQDAFSKLPLSAVSSQRLMAEMGRHGRDVERSLIPGQVNEVAALKSMELKVNASMMAAEARAAEKQMKQFDKTLKSLRPREKDNLPQPYLNFLHQIMAQIERPTSSRTPWDIKNEIANHSAEHTLEGFVKDLSDHGQETQVWPQLFEEGWHKPYAELTVDEFRNVKDSIDNLNHIGKEVKKITSAGVKANLNDKKALLIKSLSDFAVKHYDEDGRRGLGPLPPGIYLDLPRTFLANSLTLETIFGRWDHFDPFGPWTQWGLRDLIDANGEEHTMRRDIAGKLSEIYAADKTDKKLKDSVFNPLFRDTIGGNLRKFDRSNLRAVMLNTGSRGGKVSNLTYLAQGHGLKEEAILKWIDDNAAKEDWDWCQKIWGLFKNELWEPAQQMRRGLSGVGAKSLAIPPIQTPFGEYPGGYYPVIRSELGKQSERGLEKSLFGPDVIRATTWDGYAQERTGEYSPLRLDLEPMAGRIGQIIHDIKMRPAVLNAAKLFYDKDIQTVITRHYGKEYADLLEPYLRDVAGSAKYRSKAAEVFDKATDTIQKNMVVSLIGLNLGTVMKHAPTALALSLAEVGPKDFAHAVKSMYSVDEATGESNYQMIMGKLDELQNRSRTWSQTLTGAADEFVPGGEMRSLKQKIVEWSAKPIAFSDMLSSVPTGLAAYQRAIKDEYSEGDAIFLANKAVRRAHGSAAVTNRSGVQRDWPKAITTFYTFFNDMLNRRAEVVWRAADALGVTGDHTWAQAKAEIRPIAAGLFSTVFFTALVEQLVSPIHFKQDDSNAKKAALALAKDQSAGFVVARDVANWMIEGRDPSLGLYSTAFHEFGDAIKDTAKAATQRQKMSKEQAGKIIRDSAAFAGIMSGMVPMAVGKAGQFVHGTAVGIEHPKGPWGWAAGLRYGTLAGHSPTVEQWWKGR